MGSEGSIQLDPTYSNQKLRSRTAGGRFLVATDHQPINGLAGPEGDQAGVTAYGFLQATGEATTLFYDPFDGVTADTTNRWNPAVTSGAGAAVTQSNGSLAVAGGTLVSNYAYVSSRPTFNAQIPGFLQVSFLLSLETGTSAALNTNAHRFWGIGTANAAPTATAPIINGAGFEVDVDGKMYAVVYSNSVRTAVNLSSTGSGIAASTMPIDGGNHRYLLHYRTDRVFFFINGVQVATATVSPEVQTLPVRHSWVNSASSAVVGTMTYSIKGSVVADTARNGASVTDGIHGWRKAGVVDPLSFDAPPVVAGWGQGPALNTNANAIQKRTFKTSRTTANAGAPAAVTIVANTRTALFQIHHLGAATTTKRIRRLTVGALFGAAVQYGYEIYRVTAAPTGGTAVTPISDDSADAASTLVCTYLPSASGAVTGIALAGTTVLGAATGHDLLTIYDWKPASEQKPLVIRKGVLEGFCLFVRGTGTVGPDPQIYIEYTED